MVDFLEERKHGAASEVNRDFPLCARVACIITLHLGSVKLHVLATNPGDQTDRSEVASCSRDPTVLLGRTSQAPEVVPFIQLQNHNNRQQWGESSMLWWPHIYFWIRLQIFQLDWVMKWLEFGQRLQSEWPHYLAMTHYFIMWHTSVQWYEITNWWHFKSKVKG